MSVNVLQRALRPRPPVGNNDILFTAFLQVTAAFWILIIIWYNEQIMLCIGQIVRHWNIFERLILAFHLDHYSKTIPIMLCTHPNIWLWCSICYGSGKKKTVTTNNETFKARINKRWNCLLYAKLKIPKYVWDYWNRNMLSYLLLMWRN